MLNALRTEGIGNDRGEIIELLQQEGLWDVPAKLNPGVVVERRYALNWLTWYADEWDDVTTDT